MINVSRFFSKHAVLAFVTFAASPVFATDPVQDDNPGVRSNTYIGAGEDGNLSGWKGMLTNTMPDKLLASGRWFDAAPVPRPFAVAEDMAPFSDSLRTRLQNNSTDALIVVKDGTIVQEYLRYGFEIDDIHLIHSTGKVFTSFAIQPVYDRIGRDGLDLPLARYLPDLEGKFFGEATLGQSLDMKNGMEWTENYEDPTSATMLSGPVGGWDVPADGKGPESWFERMFDFEKYGDHGEVWIYNNAAVVAASFAAGSIAGRPFSDLVQISYNALGFEDRSWYVSNAFNELSAEGGQAMSVRDHAKLGRHMLETTGSAYVDDVWNVVGDPEDHADAKFLKKYGEMFGATGYKNYWYKLSPDSIAAIGSSGLFMYVDRSKNLVISKYSSFVQGQGAGEFAEAFAIISEIADQY